MKRSTAVKIIRGLTIATLSLYLGLLVAVSMLISKNDKLEEVTRTSRIIDSSYNEAVIRIDELENKIAEQEQELEGLRIQANLEYVGEFNCTAYCTEKYKHICGTGSGITASGLPVQAGVSVAVKNSKLPYGTVIYIEGIGIRIVQDTGGGVKADQIDVAVDTHEHALDWGVKQGRKVYIVKVGGINAR